MMSRTSKWITWITATILCLAVLSLAAVWRLGLLPLLLPPPLPPQPLQASEGETIQPNGEIYLSQPDNSTNSVQPENSQNDHPGPSQEEGMGAPASEDEGTMNIPSTDDWTVKSQLQQEIEARYTTKMQSLAKSYEDQLNALVGKAYTEYTTDKKKGEPVSVPAMAGKYMIMGNAMEKQSDDQFYALLDQFKAELQSNGLPLATAIRAQEVYEYDKAVRKKEILDAAAKMIESGKLGQPQKD